MKRTIDTVLLVDTCMGMESWESHGMEANVARLPWARKQMSVAELLRGWKNLLLTFMLVVVDLQQ